MHDRTRRLGADGAKPISQFVLKVHSRCDLACDHCYVYEHADQSWRGRPVGIDSTVAHVAAVRIAEHAAAHRLPAVEVVLHGGEPLLLGEKRLRAVLAELSEQIRPVTRLDLRVQTNGVRLSPELCDLFAEYGVRVGISLDGDRAANDRHRRFADGRSSHAQVRNALELLRTPEYRDLYSGILCTVDVANDPTTVLEALLDESPPRIDFLLPHANWDHPPPRPAGAETAYADWLNRVFDHWIALGRPVPIRLFDSIEALAAGGVSESEGIGPGPVSLLVIETDGEWEQVDSLKSAYAGAPATGMNVFEHAADDAAAHPAVAGRQEGIAALCETCLACPVVDRCGGGLYTHRFRSATGFRNPSVYCADLRKLIDHVGISRRSAASVRVMSAERTPAAADFATLREADLDAIADRPLDDALFGRVAYARLTITRMVFAQVGDISSSCGRSEDCCADAAWRLLCSLDENAPEAVRTVLAHPFARVWAARRLESNADCQPSCLGDGAHLGSFALAAAVRAAVPADLKVPLHDGVLYLPTLGAWDLGRATGGSVRVALQDGVLRVRDDDRHVRLRLGSSTASAEDRASAWRVARQIGGADHRVLLEDLDPYRDCHGSPAAGRVSGVQVRRWHRMLSAASTTLSSWAPQYATQVRACVRTIVPLLPDPSGKDVSATARHAFGAFGAALPAHHEQLALLMVHEAQHMVLDTVLDEHDLVDPDYRGETRVGWRTDPRPPTQVLHGVFAFLALAEVWRSRAESSALGHEVAHGLVRKYTEWTSRALDELTANGGLTPLGERFVSRLYTRMRPLRNV